MCDCRLLTTSSSVYIFGDSRRYRSFSLPAVVDQLSNCSIEKLRFLKCLFLFFIYLFIHLFICLLIYYLFIYYLFFYFFLHIYFNFFQPFTWPSQLNSHLVGYIQLHCRSELHLCTSLHLGIFTRTCRQSCDPEELPVLVDFSGIQPISNY